jgi:hypothetical protein
MLIDIGYEQFHRHRLQDAQMIRAPAHESNEKNAFHWRYFTASFRAAKTARDLAQIL